VPKFLAYALAGLAALGLSFAAGRYSTPTEVKTETETIYLTQTVHTRAVERHTETKWRRVIVAAPDGSSVTTESSETVESERSNETTENEEIGKTADKSSVTRSDDSWQVGVLGGVTIGPNWNGLQPTFAVTGGFRALGPIWLTGQIQSNRTVMLGASVTW
jgi:hypothetical protein